MNRHSVFFKLNILFVIALAATLMAGGSVIMHMVKKDRMDLLFKSRLIMKEYRIEGGDPAELFNEFGLTLIGGEEKQRVLFEYRNHSGQRIAHRKRSSVIKHQGHIYLYIHTPSVKLLLKDERTLWHRFSTPFLIMFGTILLLISMYMLLRKTLLPLKSLQKDIEYYGEGKLSEYAFSIKKDEISQVANAFYTSASRIKRLTDSRTLFIRNLFHELNTPVTKGKILTEIVDNQETKSMLDSIFSRLSILLKELAQVEQITSENYLLSKKEARILDLIDEAKDLLYLDKPIATNVTSQTVNVDFTSMSIVFKNLIDNALKYGEDLEIIYEEKGTLSFISTGEKLKGDFSSYLEAFSHQKGSGHQGFGLGLYIVNEVVLMHDMRFEYTYKEGKNRFTIHFKNTF